MGDELDRIKTEHNARQTQCDNTAKSLVDEISNQQSVASSAATELADAMGSETKAMETCRVTSGTIRTLEDDLETHTQQCNDDIADVR
jgi:hypothetical protein